MQVPDLPQYDFNALSKEDLFNRQIILVDMMQAEPVLGVMQLLGL